MPPGFRFIDNTGRTTLFKIDLDAGDLGSVESHGFEGTDDYVVDARGKLLAESEYDAAKSHWVLKTWSGRWREVQHLDAPIETPHLVGLGRDGQSVLAQFDEDHRPRLAGELRADSDTWSDPLSISDWDQPDTGPGHPRPDRPLRPRRR